MNAFGEESDDGLELAEAMQGMVPGAGSGGLYAN
jgi:hypothetical protein